MLWKQEKVGSRDIPKGWEAFCALEYGPSHDVCLARFERGAVLPSGTTGASPGEKESVMSLPVMGISLPDWDEALAGPHKRKIENAGRKAVLPQPRIGFKSQECLGLVFEPFQCCGQDVALPSDQ